MSIVVPRSKSDMIVFLIIFVEFFDQAWVPVCHEDGLEEGVGSLDYSRRFALHVIDALFNESRELSAFEEKWGIVDKEALVHSDEIIEEEWVLLYFIAIAKVIGTNFTK